MTIEQQPAELIADAFHTEGETSLFYRILAEMVTEDTLANQLMALADDEAAHARALADLHMSLTGRSVAEGPAILPEGAPDLHDFDPESLHDVLAFALKNELEAVTLYEIQADRAATAEARKIWHWLADAERSHATYLRIQLERLGDS